MNPKPIIAVTWPISASALSRLESSYEVRVNTEERALSAQELNDFVKGASAILCLLINKITEEVLSSAGGQLKVVATMSVGFDHIDREACRAKGVVVTNTPNVSEVSVAEHTIALLLALCRSVPSADSYVRQGKYLGWDPLLFNGPELEGKTLGLVGIGRIGSGVARIASLGLLMKVVYYDIRPNEELEKKYNATFVSLDELLTTSDFVSLHVPLLPATKHLINEARLSQMKSIAYLINTARGAVVDEVALVRALKAGTIAGAGLDVYENEPSITPELLELPNVVLTPHTASATFEARERMAQKAVDNILAVLESGTPIDEVKPA